MSSKLFFFLVCFFALTNTFAQTTYRNEFGFQSDNDSYLAQGSDRYYTDGLFIYFRHALKIKDPEHSSLQNKVLGFEIGQKIFNPQSGYIVNPSMVDRPFAGYLYAGSSLNLLYTNESNLKLSAQLGVVGPASSAGSIQAWVHNAFGFYSVAGWQYQIKNDPELNLSAEYNKLIARDSWIDISLSSYANLGNGFTGAGAGPLLRMGDFNQLFHSQSTQSTAIVNNRIAPLHEHELFFYYKPQANYVAYDATVQGGLLETHHTPNSLEITSAIEPFVFSQQFGVVLTSNRLTFDAAAIFHTKDVKTMVQSHQWGSLTVLYHFN